MTGALLDRLTHHVHILEMNGAQLSPQTSPADGLQAAARMKGGLVASVHDEVLLEVAEADAEAAKRLLSETMVEAFTLTFPGAPTSKVVEVKIGQTWRDVK